MRTRRSRNGYRAAAAAAVYFVLLIAMPGSAHAQPCGPGVLSPQCDGQCPEGLMCADFGSGCACVPKVAACSNPANPNGPPVCWGGCPSASMVCATFAGGCMCIPGPTPTPVLTPMPTPTPNLCGNGNLDPGELCDDHNTTSGDGCDANCTPTGCGNGITTAGEQCDGADAAVCPGNCRADCTCAVCGDGITQATEQCDGADDAACPGFCQPSCTCSQPALIAGGKLAMKDKQTPGGASVLWISKGTGIDVTTGGGFDPTTNGATLTITNANGSGEEKTVHLLASGWVAKGVPPKIVFKYKGQTSPIDPCKVALVKNQKLLKLSCANVSPADAYTLDEPSQGAIAVRLTSGPASFCAVFGGVVKDEMGLFLAKSALAPASCPP